VLINMVASLDGKTTVGGKAGSIGSSVDRTLMRTLRARADAAMVGAGTLRAEKLTLAVPENLAQERASRGLEPQPLAVIATATGDVPLPENLLSSSPDNLLVLVSPDVPEERFAALSLHASVEAVSRAPGANSGLDVNTALEVLKGRYAVEVLLVEGGPALNHALISARLADELYLTLAPKLLGGKSPDELAALEGPILGSQKRPKPKLISVHLCGDELFLRYALLPLGPTIEA
jgi:2,5-diamino-6-(ribosylamino)-4(3H)-pyrimidinone 5'-phosphate reductase